MELLDSLSTMIQLVTEPGTDSETEKYVSIPLNAPKPLFGIFKRGEPPKIYRVRNQKHPRGIAERHNLAITLRDMSGGLTLGLEIWYRVTCIPGKEEIVAESLSKETTPGEVLDQMVEGWISDFASERDNRSFYESAEGKWDRLKEQLASRAERIGLRLKVFLERQSATTRTWAFALPVSFLDQTETVSTTFRLSILPPKTEMARSLSRLNEAPANLEQETKRRIQEWFGSSVLRDSIERQTSAVKKNLTEHLDGWLSQFGMASLVEAIEAPPHEKPDIEHTIRVGGLVSLGHFQWQVWTTMEIDRPDVFLREKKERQIAGIHMWLGEQYPEFCWDAIRISGGDQSKFSLDFESHVKVAVQAIGYRLKHFILRRVLSEVELDARKQYLDSNLQQDRFLNRLIEDTQTKIVNAYSADDEPDQIAKLEARLKEMEGRRVDVIKAIATTRTDAKNTLLPEVTPAAIGAERRTWTAIADGSAATPGDHDRKPSTEGTDDNAAAAGA